MRRRDFIKGFGSTSAGWSVPASGWLGAAALEAQAQLDLPYPVAAQDGARLPIEIVAQTFPAE